MEKSSPRVSRTLPCVSRIGPRRYTSTRSGAASASRLRAAWEGQGRHHFLLEAADLSPAGAPRPASPSPPPPRSRPAPRPRGVPAEPRRAPRAAVKVSRAGRAGRPASCRRDARGCRGTLRDQRVGPRAPRGPRGRAPPARPSRGARALGSPPPLTQPRGGWGRGLVFPAFAFITLD